MRPTVGLRFESPYQGRTQELMEGVPQQRSVLTPPHPDPPHAYAPTPYSEKRLDQNLI